jgi:hypothetical protein
MYASRYGSIVASGDKMGLGAGLYINAKNGRTVKCMMEDAITGFIVYTGIQNIEFTTKSGCGNLRNTNSGTCLMKNATTVKPQSVATQIIQSVPQNQQRYANEIVAAKPRVPGGKRLIKLWLNQDINRNTATTVLNTIDKFKKFWDDSDISKIKTVLNKMRNGQGIANTNKVRASQLIGQFNAVTPNGGTPVKRPRANNNATTNKRPRANNATTNKRPRANNTTPNNRNTKRVTRAGTLFGQPQRLKNNTQNR